jgi:hypothetical protein
VLLTTRSLQVARGGRRKIDTEVTDINGQRRTDVLLNWRHDAADQLVVRIRADGIVTGNRLGRTQVFAGAGPADKGVWARVPASVEVIESDKHDGRGSGRPRLLITGRDRDPDTGTTREGDPEQPVLWQETSDEQHNIWWLNLEAPEARFAFAQRNDSAEIWRLLHASKLVAMVTQVKMKAQYTEKPENERDGRWATYKQSLENFEIEVSEPMWESLKSYVVRGGDIE